MKNLSEDNQVEIRTRNLPKRSRSANQDTETFSKCDYVSLLTYK